MASRFYSRLRVVGRALANSAKAPVRRRPSAPRRILVAHHLLLGDTLMLTPLLAALRERHPAAEIVMTTPKAIAPLYQKQPYGVRAVPYDPRDPRTLRALLAEAGYDLAIVPGDNRYSWLARALGAGWVVAFAGDRPAWKNWPVDELVPYPAAPAAWGDMVAGLAGGAAPAPYRPADWPAPDCRPFAPPAGQYCVLHVGASSPLKLWENAKWRALADQLAAMGQEVVWSGGRGEQAIVSAIDAGGKHASYAGRLDLAQLWHLIRGARLLVSPDTGIAHLGRLTHTPTVTLFGPGSAVICGAGDFWKDSPYRAVTVDPFPCRDQNFLFRRAIPWVWRCGRGLKDCPAPRCMQAISLEAVVAAARCLLDGSTARRAMAEEDNAA